MIKFDHEKVNFSNSDRIEPNDPQFLTFRNNASNNTGRSVFSQQVEIHKPVENQNLEEDEQQCPVRNFKKVNNLRAMRSQQKYKREYLPTKKLFQAETREDIITTGNQASVNQFEFKNELLKKKIQKLAKNIKNQQKKQTSLQKEIEELQRQLEDDEREIENQAVEIEELQAINDQNELYLEKLGRNFQEFEGKNDHLQSLVEKIEDSLENLLASSRSQDSKSKMASKLKEGLVRLQSLRAEVTNRCIKMQTEIQNLKLFIEHSETLDLTIRDTAYSRETENSSHFTC